MLPYSPSREHLRHASLSVVKFCVVGVYESLWPSAIPVFMSYTITYACVGKVLWSWVWVGVYLGLAVLVCFSLLVNHTHTHTWSGGEADCGSSGVFLNRFFVRSAFKTPLSNSPHSPPSPLFSPPLYLLSSPLIPDCHPDAVSWCFPAICKSNLFTSLLNGVFV